MANLTIRVGASVDQSVAAAFKSVIAAARAAERTQVASNAAGTRTARAEAGKQADAHVKATEKWMKQRDRIIQNSARMAGQVAAKEAATEKRLADQQVKDTELAAKRKIDAMVRMDKIVTQAKEQELRRRNQLDAKYFREAERDLVRRQRTRQRVDDTNWGNLKGSVSRGTMAGLGIVAGAGRRALGFASDVVSDLASGAGVNFNVGSHVASNVALESQAVAVSNSGYIAGDKTNGQRVAPGALVREARDVGTATAFDPSQILGGLQAFAGKTGDLQAGRDVMKDLAVLSKATGTNLEDMVDAAGDVYSALGDIPNKGEAIARVMKAIAGQGKLGAVEVKNLATQMAKLGAATGKFEGSGEQNLAIFGAFAQEARQRGGASSATQAATSVQSFANTFSKSARFNAFKLLDIDVMSATEKGKFRDPREIIIEALQKTGGDPNKMNKLVADAGAKKVVGGFQTVFQNAFNASGGSEQERLAAATKAVREEMDRLTQAAMGEGEIRESFTAAMGTTESKVTIFNNKMGALVEQLETAALPSFERLGPELLKLVEASVKLAPTFVGLANIFTGRLGKLLGISQNVEEQGAVEVDLRASNSASALRAGLRSGKVSTADAATADESAMALEKAIAAKRSAVAEQEKGVKLLSFDRAASGDVNTPTAAESEAADQLRANERQLSEMVRTRETLSALLKEIRDKKEMGTPKAPRGAPYETGVFGPWRY